MKNEVTARPYARALFSLAREHGLQEQIAQELGQVLEVWDGDVAFRGLIRRPEVSHACKHDTVDRLFSGLHLTTRHLLEVVIDKNRTEILSTIYEEYRNLWDESRGIVHAEVASAKELTGAEVQSWVKALSLATGLTVEVTRRRDPSLMAGVVVTMGDRVLDGSLARRLSVLGDRLRSIDGGGSVVEH